MLFYVLVRCELGVDLECRCTAGFVASLKIVKVAKYLLPNCSGQRGHRGERKG